jgi:hypothetical protein
MPQVKMILLVERSVLQVFSNLLELARARGLERGALGIWAVSIERYLNHKKEIGAK